MSKNLLYMKQRSLQLNFMLLALAEKESFLKGLTTVKEK